MSKDVKLIIMSYIMLVPGAVFTLLGDWYILIGGVCSLTALCGFLINIFYKEAPNAN